MTDKTQCGCLDEADLVVAADMLSKSQRGRHSLRAILKWLDDGGLSLDGDNKSSAMTLIEGAFGDFPGTARDLMRAALESK